MTSVRSREGGGAHSLSVHHSGSRLSAFGPRQPVTRLTPNRAPGLLFLICVYFLYFFSPAFGCSSICDIWTEKVILSRLARFPVFCVVLVKGLVVNIHFEKSIINLRNADIEGACLQSCSAAVAGKGGGSHSKAPMCQEHRTMPGEAVNGRCFVWNSLMKMSGTGRQTATHDLICLAPTQRRGDAGMPPPAPRPAGCRRLPSVSRRLGVRHSITVPSLTRSCATKWLVGVRASLWCVWSSPQRLEAWRGWRGGGGARVDGLEGFKT